MPRKAKRDSRWTQVRCFLVGSADRPKGSLMKGLATFMAQLGVVGLAFVGDVSIKASHSSQACL